MSGFGNGYRDRSSGAIHDWEHEEDWGGHIDDWIDITSIGEPVMRQYSPSSGYKRSRSKNYGAWKREE